MKIRYISAAAMALVVAVGLFWVMKYLITNNDAGLNESDDLRMVDFVRVQQEDTVKERKRELPKKPPPPKRPPPPPELKVSQQATKPQSPEIKMDIPDVRVGMDLALGQMGSVGGPTEMADTGTAIPKATFPPQYPPDAARRGIEGWVEVEFTVTEQGTVADVTVVSAKPRKIFDKAAKRAISKYTFRPAMADGKPVAVRMRQKIDFNL